MIYFDNAATTSPKPPGVTHAVTEAMIKYSANPGRAGHSKSLECAEMIYGVRKKAAAYFHAQSPENIVFAPNCTAALNTVICGLFKSGDHIIISSLEHNAVARPVYNLQNIGCTYDVASVSSDDDETVENFRLLICDKTRGIICTHASNVFGTILPIEKLARLCRNNDLYFSVDAAQTAGILPINMKEMNIDYLCVAAHKGLYAPVGAGMLITDSKPAPLTYGGTGSNSFELTQPDYVPDRYESGTLNVPTIAGIGAGIDFVTKLGGEIYKSEQKQIARIIDAFSAHEEIKLYINKDEKRVPVLSFNVKGKQSEKVSDILNRHSIAVRAGLHCAPLAHVSHGTDEQGTVRVCPSVFTEKRDVDALIGVTEQFCI